MVRYEWDVETVTIADTAEWEEGEVLDHNHRDSKADALRCAAATPPEGTRYEVVLVRDDDESRSWAYLLPDGTMPEFFLDAIGDEVARVPKKFR